MENASVKCRVCWEEQSNKACIAMSSRWSKEVTLNIKDILIFCVPSLSVENESHICKLCLWQLKYTYDFIEKCLLTEKLLNPQKEQAENNKSTDNIEQNTSKSDKLENVLKNCLINGNKIKIVFETPFATTEDHSNNQNSELAREKDETNKPMSTENNDWSNDNADVCVLSDTDQEEPLKPSVNIERQKRRKFQSISENIQQNTDFSQDSIALFTTKFGIPPEYHQQFSENGLKVFTIPSKNPRAVKRAIFLGKCLEIDEPFIYACEECPARFCTEGALINHLKVHTRPFKCQRCGKGYKRLQDIEDHSKMFDGLPDCIFKCQRCKKEFSACHLLERHLNYVNDAPVCDFKQCTVCLEKFSKEDFKNHSKIHPTYQCQTCRKLFSTYVLLFSHKSNVHGKARAMCEECGKIFKSKQGLRVHLTVVHPKGEDKSYMCDKCPSRYYTKGLLTRHQLRRHTNMKTHVQCELCGKKFSTRSGLNTHQREQHSDEKKYPCPICNEGFARKDYMNRHLRQHDRFQYSCKICKKSYMKPWGLQHHMLNGHDENGRPNMFRRKAIWTDANSTITKGVFKKNTSKKKFVCKICKKILTSLNNLKLHYKVHLKLKKFPCDKCGIILQTHTALNKHRKLHDDPNYKFSCKICHAYKSSDLELQLHMQNTHKTRKYKCKLCPAAFGRRYLLDSHETAVHREILTKKEEIYKLLSEEKATVVSVEEEQYDPRNRNNKGKVEEDLDTLLSFVKGTSNVETERISPSGVAWGELWGL